MKKWLLLSFLAYAFTGYGQSDTVRVRRNVLKITPLAVLGHVSVFYERMVAPRTSVVVGVGFGREAYRYENNSTQVPEPGLYHYERLTLEGRHYFGHHAPFGAFVGGYGRFARLSIRDYTFDRDKFVRDGAGNLVLVDKQMTVTTIGGYVGYQTALFRRITAEIFMGLQVQVPSAGKLSTHALPEAMSSAGVVGRLGLTAGYSF